jgi:hypothetical protein
MSNGAAWAHHGIGVAVEVNVYGCRWLYPEEGIMDGCRNTDEVCDSHLIFADVRLAPLNSIDAVLMGIAQVPPIPYASAVSGINPTAFR